MVIHTVAMIVISLGCSCRLNRQERPQSTPTAEHYKDIVSTNTTLASMLLKE